MGLCSNFRPFVRGVSASRSRRDCAPPPHLDEAVRRLIGREVGLSKNTVANIVKRHRATAIQRRSADHDRNLDGLHHERLSDRYLPLMTRMLGLGLFLAILGMGWASEGSAQLAETGVGLLVDIYILAIVLAAPAFASRLFSGPRFTPHIGVLLLVYAIGAVCSGTVAWRLGGNEFHLLFWAVAGTACCCGRPGAAGWSDFVSGCGCHCQGTGSSTT